MFGKKKKPIPVEENPVSEVTEEETLATEAPAIEEIPLTKEKRSFFKRKNKSKETLPPEETAEIPQENLNLPMVVEPQTEVKEKKLTLAEYERKYTKRVNARGVKFAARLAATVIGVFLFALLALIAIDLYKLNEYVGYAAAVAFVILYIFVFVVPLVKIMRTGYFMTNVNANTAREAQRRNRKLRHDIAEKIIDFTAKVEGAGWYDSAVVGKMAIALETGDENALKTHLSELYKGSIKKSAKELIFKRSLKSAGFSMLSQSDKLDSALITVVNLQLIKDIVYLYGFRPSDARLLKIFGSVIVSSLSAYGIGSVNVGNAVVKTMGEAVRGIPLLGSAIATVVDSSVQGLVNGTITTLIGYQTIKYLNKEYKLQDILDGVDVSETPTELKEAYSELETQLKNRKKQPA